MWLPHLFAHHRHGNRPATSSRPWWRWLAAAAGLALSLSVAADAAAQGSESAPGIDFDRPEAWAMKYFTSASLLAATPTLPGDPNTDRTSLGLGLTWLPQLSTAQQRVGFNGTAQDDLNQAPLFLEPRVTLPVGPSLTITVAGLPPVRLFGVTPKLIAGGVDWTLRRSPDWTIVTRAHGQVGHITAAITCPDSVLPFPPGSDGNPRGCDSRSEDVSSLRYASVELDLARRLTASGRLAAQGSLGLNFVDGVFQTGAHTFGVLDQTRLTSRGVVGSGSFGLAFALGRRLVASVEALYAPLRIRRPAESTSFDSLITARAVLAYRLR